MYILPQPKKMEERAGSFVLSYLNAIVMSPKVRADGTFCAELLQKTVRTETGLSLRVLAGEAQRGDICLTISEDLKPQAYRLLIEADGVSVVGGDGAGVLYGVETLCQIIEQCGSILPCMEITDAPDIENRGYYLDETRGRVLKLDYLKKTVDRLCRYKINQFQLYVEHTYLFRGCSEMWRDETPLLAEEIMELDAYCKERHVELIPSLASFGHLYMLLSTRTYGDLCEFDAPWEEPFSFWDRMRHHTVNVTDNRAMQLMKANIEEYMALFSSDKFNICADETFDLGRGKAKQAADEKGVHRLYIDFIKELCAFVVEKGKVPMFWGDIICGSPELVTELPEATICLNWGYAPNQREEETRALAAAGAKQYLCPGVGGWNQWMNLIENSYQNITRMCGYARKYDAPGILNTDWGDAGHINQPEFSVPGIIYGAAFSWNPVEIPFEEINRRISVLEYRDSSETIVSRMAQLPQYSIFQWWDAVLYYEQNVLKHDSEGQKTLPGPEECEAVCGANQSLAEIGRSLFESARTMGEADRGLMQALCVTLHGIQIWNQIGQTLGGEHAGGPGDEVRAAGLAGELESWFMSYKELWREIGKEGDLHHIAEIVFWYADLLRGRRTI